MPEKRFGPASAQQIADALHNNTVAYLVDIRLYFYVQVDTQKIKHSC